MDFRTLLEKYMRHVMQCEGSTFERDLGGPQSEVVFSSDELNTLRAMAAAIEAAPWDEPSAAPGS